MEKQCFTWSQLGEEWIGAMYTWADVCILIKASEGGGGNPNMYSIAPHTFLPPVEVAKDRLDKKEYKRFIELVCKINGISIKETKARKERGEVEVTLSEIQKLYEDVNKAVVLKRISREDI